MMKGKSGDLMADEEKNRAGESDLTMRKAEYTTLLAVGMTWPPPLWSGS